MSDPATAPGDVLTNDNTSIALQKLDNLPPAGPKGKDVPVPFRYAYERPFSIAQGDLDKAKLQSVPLKGLIALEPVVKRKRVEDCIRGSDHMDAPPWVVQYAGDNYCLDGHHRMTAHDLLGDESVTAHVVRGKPKS